MANIGPPKQSSSSASASASCQAYRPYAATAAAPAAPSGAPPPSFQRDAVYSEIFGGRPPPDRSHTMTSQTSMSNSGGRSRTMTSHTPDPYMTANLRQNPNSTAAYAHGHPPHAGNHGGHHRPPPALHGHPQYMHPQQRPSLAVGQRSPMPGTPATMPMGSIPGHAANAAATAAAAGFS
ncbi:RHO1 GDP-GTP exchange protein 2, partial [Ascosphaera aggregata]